MIRWMISVVVTMLCAVCTVRMMPRRFGSCGSRSVPSRQEQVALNQASHHPTRAASATHFVGVPAVDVRRRLRRAVGHQVHVAERIQERGRHSVRRADHDVVDVLGTDAGTRERSPRRMRTEFPQQTAAAPVPRPTRQESMPSTRSCSAMIGWLDPLTRFTTSSSCTPATTYKPCSCAALRNSMWPTSVRSNPTEMRCWAAGGEYRNHPSPKVGGQQPYEKGQRRRPRRRRGRQATPAGGVQRSVLAKRS